MKSTWRNILIAISIISGIAFVIAVFLLGTTVYLQLTSQPDASLALDALKILIPGAISIITFIAGKRIKSKSEFPPIEYDFTTPAHKRYRQILIDNVRNDWIKDVYEKSLYHFARIDLGLKTKPDALDRQRTFRSADGESQELPPTTSMSQVYRNANQHLLILGQPGSGKTTMLLELERDLLDEAEKYIELPMPVVFNLSSWAEKRGPLAEWIVEKLNSDYGVNRKLGEKWVAADLLLLLLDGLDEVREDCREACAEAINTYKVEHGQNGLVVCSRINEYEELSQKLDLRYVVELQPLTLEKAREYLSKSDADMSGLLEALEGDPELQELAERPLMLNIMGLAYKAQPVSEIIQAYGRSIYQRIFNQYVQRMFDRPLDRSDPGTYSQIKTLHYLTWLAGKLVQQEQTEFYLENLQPTWLVKGQQKRTNKLLRVSLAIIIGVIAGLGFGLFVGSILGPRIGLPVGLFAGLIFGSLIISRIGGEKHQPVDRLVLSWTKGRYGLLAGILIGLLIGLLGGLLVAPGIGLLTGLLAAISVGLIFGLEYGGAAFLNHYIIRFVLKRDGCIPRDYVGFLDYAAERILLRKKGGGYIFIHRMLMEYFAGLDV